MIRWALRLLDDDQRADMYAWAIIGCSAVYFGAHVVWWLLKGGPTG